ncbi:MAG TPA: DUF4824 family protein [Bryobacteraceae bacterium]|nr:DUF4824 family protein [Bryobacteraceae bacterium]
MKKPGLLLAAAVVIVSNALVLIGVARNRAGAPVETIQLTQRELPKGFSEKEDTGVSLRFNWNMGLPTTYPYSSFSWLDQAKLESIGFNTTAALRDPKHQPLPRPAFVAFEYNGPAWEQWVQARKQESGQFDPTALSRLVPIDAGKSAEQLLQKYSDRQRYLIVRGVIRAFVNTGKASKQLDGSVSEILPQNVHVPPSLATAFSASTYTVTLAYGHRFEPGVIGH